MGKRKAPDKEIDAMRKVMNALDGLSPQGAIRVLEWALQKKNELPYREQPELYCAPGLTTPITQNI